jgi:hypothetical protein
MTPTVVTDIAPSRSSPYSNNSHYRTATTIMTERDVATIVKLTGVNVTVVD